MKKFSLVRISVGVVITLCVLAVIIMFFYFTGIFVPDPSGFDTEISGSGVAIVSFSGDEKVVKIPSSVGSKKVVAVSEKAFYKNNNITKVVLPETIKTVGDKVFSECKNLKEVEFKSEYTSMGDGIFENSGIVKVSLPTKLRKITDNMFKDCKSVTQVSFPDNLMGIGDSAFEGCTSIKSMIIGGTVQKIGKNAFANCGDDFKLSSVIGSKTEKYAIDNDIQYTPCNDYYDIYEIYPLYTGDNIYNSQIVSENKGGVLRYTPSKTGYYRVSLHNDNMKFKITSVLDSLQVCSEIRGNKNDYIANFEEGSDYFIPVKALSFEDYRITVKPVSEAVMGLYKKGEKMVNGKGSIDLKAGTPLKLDHSSSADEVAEVNSDITLTKVIDYYVEDEKTIWYKIETKSNGTKQGRWFKG